MFDATFNNVKAILDRTVNLEGRIPRLSDYKGCRVAVIILEGVCNNPPSRENALYQASLSGTGTYIPNTNIDVTSDQARVDPDDQDTSATEGV